ncbi:hypothetical protein T265_10530 [Opisthorchis viverrini]|uniref:Uncharacterized protein n=1 Tax=Opisthorchis viverrini TaxID=6198 RepID=A0A074Z679_OPIVI|nr:hypothetical protein T265_10530 [Opisthorchis viverrini]KER21062.1 hypothetical protein T265_10530 [Opisthorchis viverrini]
MWEGCNLPNRSRPTNTSMNLNPGAVIQTVSSHLDRCEWREIQPKLRMTTTVLDRENRLSTVAAEDGGHQSYHHTHYYKLTQRQPIRPSPALLRLEAISELQADTTFQNSSDRAGQPYMTNRDAYCGLVQ